MLHEIAQHLDTARQFDRAFHDTHSLNDLMVANLYRELAHDMMDAAVEPRKEDA